MMLLSTQTTNTALSIATALLIILNGRRNGGFYYRTMANLVCLATSASCGMFIALFLRLAGRPDLINWTSTRLYYYLVSLLTGVSVKIEGQEHLTSTGSKVIVCNHQSSLDMVFGGRVIPKGTSIVAKKAIKFYPLLGWYLSLSKTIFLDRANRDNAVKAARRAAKDIHRKKTSVWIFPEGTRYHGADINLLPFKKGAFYMAVQARVPIVPVVIENYDKIYDSKERRFESGTVRIKVLPPVPTTDVPEDSDSIDKLCTQVREDMLKTLKELSAPKVIEEEKQQPQKPTFQFSTKL
ncbi:hypothetical protein BDA99DRAFT_547118 [Phascolomyces articulosus]|uniref:1-acyl-sn-glycerol-3-phosphate acyltransferase n=1 Tax=Phascolomyces articulosus TaxID=60185 RepID=A0AAD5PDT6_9FUNG|nr:hypothetical protein BDA99DRAFT_547118 [Phascolomyces articulosus]